MFSSRLRHDLTPEALSEVLDAHRLAGTEVLDLTETNPTRAGLDYPGPEILAALADPRALTYEPSPRGLRAAREAVAEYYRSLGRRVDPDSIFLTASTSEAYAFVFKLLADPGDEILVPRPSYPLFELLAGLEGLRPVQYMLRHGDDGWRIDLDLLRASIIDRTRALVVVSPNNPTGSYLRRHDLAELNRLCTANDIALMVDEVFLDYRARSFASPAETTAGNPVALTFVLSGLSKLVGLPQVKLGWIQVSGPDRLVARAIERLEFIADTYLSVSGSVQHAAPKLLALRERIQAAIVERVESNEARLRNRWSMVPDGRVLAREGGWYALARLPEDVTDETAARTLLEEDNVVVHPGYFYDFEEGNVLVLSLLTPPEVFAAGLDKVAARFGGGEPR
jgi:alanine-synthesizing transaminase